MKSKILSYVFILMIVSAIGGINLLGRIYVHEPVGQGDEAQLFINLYNPLEEDIDDIIVRAVFFELGDIAVSRPIEVDYKENEAVWLNLDIPRNARKGDHLVKIIASNDDYHDSDFLYVRVI